MLFTLSQLKKLHDRVGHPISQSLLHLQQRAMAQYCNADIQRRMKAFNRCCRASNTYASKPVSFCVSMPQDEIVFNHEIEVDLFWNVGFFTPLIEDICTLWLILSAIRNLNIHLTSLKIRFLQCLLGFRITSPKTERLTSALMFFRMSAQKLLSSLVRNRWNLITSYCYLIVIIPSFSVFLEI